MIKLTDILSEIKVINPNNYKEYTAGWWLMKLPEPYRSQAIKNLRSEENKDYYEKAVKNKTYEDIDKAILDAFEWGDSNEGVIYWRGIYNRSKSMVKEIKVNRPSKMWDLDKPGVKYENIKVGDILQFTLYQPWKESVKQKVTSIDDRYIRTHDLTNKDELKTPSGEDVWTKNDLETYYQLNKVDEIKVNQPKQIKLPLIINSTEEYKRMIPILNQQGYTWLGYPFKESDIEAFTDFPKIFDKYNPNKNNKNLHLI